MQVLQSSRAIAEILHQILPPYVPELSKLRERGRILECMSMIASYFSQIYLHILEKNISQ